MSTQFKVDYTAMVGHAGVNTLMKNAGLGVNGAYWPITYTLTWNPGEVVDFARAEKLIPVLKQGIDEGGNLDCASVEVTRIYSVEVEDLIENGK